MAVRQVFPAALLSPTLLILREREPDNTDKVKQGQGFQTSEALVAGLGSGHPQIWPLDLSICRHEQIHASSLVAVLHRRIERLGETRAARASRPIACSPNLRRSHGGHPQI